MSFEIRIFIGFIQSNEVKMHIRQSPKWKEDKILGKHSLFEAHWQEKDYIGFFIPSSLTYRQLREKEEEIKTQFQIYCPKLNLDPHSVYLFSQLFLH